MLMRILNYLLNRLPFFKTIDGYKTKIAGVLVALAAVIVASAPFIPSPYDVYAVSISELITQIAGVLGTVGVAGMFAKKWELPKFPKKPEVPDMVK